MHPLIRYYIVGPSAIRARSDQTQVCYSRAAIILHAILNVMKCKNEFGVGQLTIALRWIKELSDTTHTNCWSPVHCQTMKPAPS